MDTPHHTIVPGQLDAALLAQACGGTPRDWEQNAPVDGAPAVTGRPELSLWVSHSGARLACALGWPSSAAFRYQRAASTGLGSTP